MRDALTYSLPISLSGYEQFINICTYTVFMVLILVTWITKVVVESFELGEAPARRKG